MAIIITAHIAMNIAAAPSQLCPGMRIQGIDAPATIATRSAVIFIVSPHPIRTAVALVTPLRHEIEVLVVDIHHVDAARVR